MDSSSRRFWCSPPACAAVVLMVGLALVGMPASASMPAVVPGVPGTVWATDRSTNTVAAFDAASGTVLATLPVGVRPIGVAAPRGTGKIYVSDEESSQLSIIAKGAGSRSAILSLPGLKPHHILASDDGRRLYVAGWNSPRVAVIDTATDTLISPYWVTSALPNARTHAIALTTDGRLLATNAGSNELAVLDTRTGGLLWTLSVGANPSEVLVDPSGTLAYVSIRDEDELEVVDLAQRAVVRTVALEADQPDTLQLTPDGKTLVIGMRDTTGAKVITVNVGGDDAVEVITLAAWKTTGHNWLSADGRYTFIAVEAWSAAAAPPSVAVIDHQTQALVASYPYPSLGGSGLPVPHGVIYDARPFVSLLPLVARR